jgi:hypothetical protein
MNPELAGVGQRWVPACLPACLHREQEGWVGEDEPSLTAQCGLRGKGERQAGSLHIINDKHCTPVIIARQNVDPPKRMHPPFSFHPIDGEDWHPPWLCKKKKENFL